MKIRAHFLLGLGLIFASLAFADAPTSEQTAKTEGATPAPASNSKLLQAQELLFQDVVKLRRSIIAAGNPGLSIFVDPDAQKKHESDERRYCFSLGAVRENSVGLSNDTLFAFWPAYGFFNKKEPAISAPIVRVVRLSEVLQSFCYKHTDEELKRVPTIDDVHATLDELATKTNELLLLLKVTEAAEK